MKLPLRISVIALDDITKLSLVVDADGLTVSKDDLVDYINNSSAPTEEQRKLEKPALVGNTRFGVGVSERMVVERAQRQYEYEVTPAKEAERLKRVREFVASCQKECCGGVIYRDPGGPEYPCADCPDRPDREVNEALRSPPTAEAMTMSKAMQRVRERSRKQKRVKYIVESLQKFMATYDNQSSYLDYEDDTIIEDVVYGLGIALEPSEYRFGDGLDKFKIRLIQKWMPKLADKLPREPQGGGNGSR